MTPTTSAVKQAAQQAVSANPDADTRTQVIAALRALGIEPHTEVQYNRVKKHVVAARNPRPRGGARPNSGRPVTLPADRRGGARPGSGPIQVRLRIGKVAGQELRILTLARRALTGNQAITPDDVAADIIHAAWLEYDAGVEEAGEDAS